MNATTKRSRSKSETLPLFPDATQAATSVCACGAAMVLRHNHKTGTQFMGCSRWPACRRTANVTQIPQDEMVRLQKEVYTTKCILAEREALLRLQKARIVELQHLLTLTEHRIAAIETQLHTVTQGPATPALTRKELTRLITLAHPDRWHQGSAQALAHEMTAALLALRDQAEKGVQR